ncbi:MAG: AAA family ATPase, partial [Planctomycetia bacterium]
MDVNLKSLIGKLDRTCHRGLELAAALCQSRANYDVELEHWLFRLREDAGNDLARIEKQFDCNPDRITAGLSKALDRLKTGSARTPSLSPTLIDAIKAAWLMASLEYGHAQVRSGVLLLAVLADPRLGPQLKDASPEYAKVNIDQLKAALPQIVAASSEEAEIGALTASTAAGASAGAASGGMAGGGGAPSKTPSLDQFTIDLTARAKAGKIDPVLGRDNEVRQIVDILTRRRQNNPILTGEAGVGKTAVVEGFAVRVAAKDVPPPLQNVAVRSLDLGLLQAGAGVKGEFENRLKSVIQEVNASPTPVILFIDEAHTMIGAGGAAGQGDAANLLKPALARGELRTIAATTWAEYKKYFEKDAALARRFQVVKVEEPTEENAVRMMRGITEMLEKHHKVDILDEAVTASVHMSARYITGRQLPDKSVSLLDTACARVAIGQSAVPPQVEDARRTLQLLEAERKALAAEQAAGGDQAAQITRIDDELATGKTTLAGLEERWTKEKAFVDEIRALRTKLKEKAAAGVADTDPEIAAARKDLESKTKE